MERRWFAWSMSAWLLAACAGPAQVRESAGGPRVLRTSSAGSSAAKSPRASKRKTTLSSDVVQSSKTADQASKERDAESTPAIRGTAPTLARAGKGREDTALTTAPSSVDLQAEAEEQERAIVAAGIEGTMSEYDVKATLDGRSADFDRCHEGGRGSGGHIKFRIRILPNGDVSDVNVRRSSVRNQDIVGCYTDVIMASRFPSPHGGYADVTWQTKVGKSRPRADEWFERKVRWDAPADGGRADRSERRSRRSSRRHGGDS